MNYIELNLNNKKKMQGTCQNHKKFEWEDSNIIDLLQGNLPEIKNTSNNNNIISLYHDLKQKYNSYNFFTTNIVDFINEINEKVKKIRHIDPFWSGVNLYSFDETIKMHKFCLISGEGGIGKSFFIKCLEEELTNKKIKHLCLYGKFFKDIKTIDFDEIIPIANTEEFVFIFDAINEIDEICQIELSKKIQELKSIRGFRFIITYRSHTMDESILSEYKKLTESEYEFSGVSFESVLEWLQKEPVLDINEYVDVLYSNNPFLLSKLPFILKGKQDKNNISRFTYIYEQFIKKSLEKPTWFKTKAVAKFMYENNTKNVTLKEMDSIIDSSLDYVSKMEQQGFLTSFYYNNTKHYAFLIESLADYLIARHMWHEIDGKRTDECIQIINQKLDLFYDINRESLVIMLFDKFAPNYILIKRILTETNLLSDLMPETIVKIHFNKDDIPKFLECFNPTTKTDCLLYFAGYVDKPFNCTNLINYYYIEDNKKQTEELSKQLSGRHFFSRLKGRLKNILYMTCKYECEKSRTLENFYTAIWCTSACNQDIRILADKILYEVIQRNLWLIEPLIDFFKKIHDDYIKDSIIFVLSSCQQNSKIRNFFTELINNQDFVLAKSLKRIFDYLGNSYGYINCSKKNLFCLESVTPSENFIDILQSVDLYEKNLLPFRFWGADSFTGHNDFLKIDKKVISDFNTKLKNDFACVKTGDCNGNLMFSKKVEEYYGVSFEDQTLAKQEFLSSFEKVFTDVFSLYGLPFNRNDRKYIDGSDFESSLLRKCTCISIDRFYGSLMCNYYSSDFGTFNNSQDSIGYEIYDPLEYIEELNITGPISTFQPKIEKMGDLILSKAELPLIKNEKWWKDLSITKRNIINFLRPIMFDNHEWLILSAIISIKDDIQNYTWKDNYNIFVCTSMIETIKGDREDRYLTIETDDYIGNLLDYKKINQKPWLCKSVREISYGTDLFDETQLVLPPSQIISLLNLELNLDEMCWYNQAGEKIICCNNNRSSYYHDPIMGTIFIRKDAYEKLEKMVPVKYFSFAERFLSDKGFCNETDYHFEIINGEIIKAFPNSGYVSSNSKNDENEGCENCKYGFYCKSDNSNLQIILDELLQEYGG